MNELNDNPLRRAYEQEVENLSNLADELFYQGKTSKEVAQRLHQERRNLGIKYKDATPELLREYIYYVNRRRYGDPLGPTFEYLVGRGKSFEQIIESASRPNPDINKLLAGFEDWLRGTE